MTTANKIEVLDDPKEGLKLFLELHRVWAARVPESLRGEDPRFLSDFLELCDSRGGVTQTVLCGRLCERFKVDQSRISRLSAKLRKAGFVRDDTPQRDRRRRLTKLTPKGREILLELWAELKLTPQKLRSEAELDAHINSLFS